MACVVRRGTTDRWILSTPQPETLYLTYNDVMVEIDPQTGKVLDTSKLAFPERAVLKFSNAGPAGDWKQLKADLVSAGFESTFLNYPKGATSGYFCLPETISEETLEKVRGLKLVVDGQELAWERCEGA